MIEFDGAVPGIRTGKHCPGAEGKKRIWVAVVDSEESARFMDIDTAEMTSKEEMHEFC